MKTANETDWIDWPGGECPVDKDALVYIRLRCGKEHKEPYPAHGFMWRHLNTDADIVAYRTQPLQPPPGKQWHNPAGLKDAGKDQRFLILEEADGRFADVAQMWCPVEHKWQGPENVAANSDSFTYRVPASTPFPPFPAPEPVAEKPITLPHPDKFAWTLSRHLPGFRELVAGEAWHKTDGWTPAMLEGGRRPLLLGETGDYEYFDEMRGWMPGGQPAKPTPKGLLRCCATRRPLPSIEPQYRALLPGEKVQEGDEMRKSGSNDPWQDSVTWRWRGIQAPGLEYRTLRPSTPAKEEPYLPKKGEHYECRKIGDAVWMPQLAMRDGTKDDLSRWEFRPCSPPELSTVELADRLLDLTACGVTNFPTGMTAPTPIFTIPELTTQIEPAMNQTQSPSTPEINLPAVGSRWAIEDRDKIHIGRILAASPTGIYHDCKRTHGVYSVEEWGGLIRTQIPDRRELRRQAKAATPPYAIYRPGPSIFKQLRRYAYVAAIATLFANQTRTGIAKAASNLGAPEFVVQWLKA